MDITLTAGSSTNGTVDLFHSYSGFGPVAELRSSLGENDRRVPDTTFDAALNGIESFLLALYSQSPKLFGPDHKQTFERALQTAYEKICTVYDED